MVRANSSSAFLPAPNSSNPRVTFTYQHFPSPLLSSKHNCRSNPQLRQNSLNAHTNPAQAKISKHSPRKPTFIAQIQH